MLNFVRTANGALVQTSLLLGLPHTVYQYSTLNEKLSIIKDTALSSTDRPRLRYVVIGNGGHTVVGSTGSNAPRTIKPLVHQPEDEAPFNMIPFVLRELTNDLTVAERTNYRLRRLEVHGVTSYYAYYGKILDVSTTQPLLEMRTVVDGVTSADPYAPSSTNLSPTAPDIDSSGVITTSGNYITATAKVPFELTATDITELQNVSEILYGDVAYSLASEFGFCTGVDVTLTGDSNGSSISYSEVKACQVHSFFNKFYLLDSSSKGVSLTIDAGAAEALLVVNS